MKRKNYIISISAITTLALLFCRSAYPCDLIAHKSTVKKSALRGSLMTGSGAREKKINSISRSMRAYYILLAEKIRKFYPRKFKDLSANKIIDTEFNDRLNKLADILTPILKNLDKNNVTVESVKELFSSSTEELIYNHIEEIRDAFFLKVILDGEEIGFLRQLAWGHNSPDIALCEGLSGCLFKALVKAGFQPGKEVDYGRIKSKRNGSFHFFIKLKGRDGWIAIDLGTSMFIHRNIRHVVVDKFERHKKRMQSFLDYWNRDKALAFLDTKALPLSNLFNLLYEHKAELIEKPLLTHASTVSEIAKKLRDNLPRDVEEKTKLASNEDVGDFEKTFRRRYGGKTLGVIELTRFAERLGFKVPYFDKIGTEIFNGFLKNNSITREGIDKIYASHLVDMESEEYEREGPDSFDWIDRMPYRPKAYIDIQALFSKGEFTQEQESRLRQIFNRIRAEGYPVVAIRSSSILEDSREYQFKGVYDSEFLCFSEDVEEDLRSFKEKIKIVYATIFSPGAREYRLKNNIPDEDEMGILIQRVVGALHEHNRFYPPLSGVTLFRPYNPNATISDLNLGLNTKTVRGEYRYRVAYVADPSGKTHYSGSVPGTESYAGRHRNEYDYIDTYMAQVVKNTIDGTIEELFVKYREDKKQFLNKLSGSFDSMRFSDEFTAKMDAIARAIRESKGMPVELEWAVDDEGEINIYQLRFSYDPDKILQEDVEIEKVSPRRIIAQSNVVSGHGQIVAPIIVVQDFDSLVAILYASREIYTETGTNEYIVATSLEHVLETGNVASYFISSQLPGMVGLLNISDDPVALAAHWSEGLISRNIPIISTTKINQELLDRICKEAKVDRRVKYSRSLVMMAVNGAEQRGQIYLPKEERLRLASNENVGDGIDMVNALRKKEYPAIIKALRLAERDGTEEGLDAYIKTMRGLAEGGNLQERSLVKEFFRSYDFVFSEISGDTKLKLLGLSKIADYSRTRLASNEKIKGGTDTSVDVREDEDEEAQKIIAGMWNALVAKKWNTAVEFARDLAKKGYVITLIPKKISEKNAKKLKEAGIIVSPQIELLEDLQPSIPLKKEDPSFHRYNISGLVYSLLLPGPRPSEKLVLMRRVPGEVDVIEMISLGTSFSGPQDFAIYTSTFSYLYGLSFSGYPGCNANCMRVRIPMDRPEATRKEYLSAIKDSTYLKGISEDSFVRTLFSGSYATVVLVEREGRFIIHKEAVGRGRQKVLEEVKWLQALPPELKKRFPEIYNLYIGEDRVWADFQYYPWSSLSQLIFWGGFRDPKADLDSHPYFEAIARNIFSFLLHIYKGSVEDFYKVKLEETPLDFFERFHRDKKIIPRLKEAITRAPILEPIISSPVIEIDGEKMLGALPLLELIYKANRETGLLNPPYLSMCHGDMNIGNILVSARDLSAGNFRPETRFIDPRGWIDVQTGDFIGQDYMYDFAKLMYHFYGYWELIRRDIHLVREERDSKNGYPSFYYSDADLIDEVEMEDYNPNVLIYRYLHKEFLTFLLKENDFFGLEYGAVWKMRLLFTIASAMISDTPFAIKEHGNELQAKTEYVGGTLLLNEFWDGFIKYLDLEYAELASQLRREYAAILQSGTFSQAKPVGGSEKRPLASNANLVNLNNLQDTPVFFLENQVRANPDGFREALNGLDKTNTVVVIVDSEAKKKDFINKFCIDTGLIDYDFATMTRRELGLTELNFKPEKVLRPIFGIKDLRCIPLTASICSSYPALKQARDRV